jgi:hypothetical protein
LRLGIESWIFGTLGFELEMYESKKTKEREKALLKRHCILIDLRDGQNQYIAFALFIVHDIDSQLESFYTCIYCITCLFGVSILFDSNNM